MIVRCSIVCHRCAQLQASQQYKNNAFQTIQTYATKNSDMAVIKAVSETKFYESIMERNIRLLAGTTKFRAT